MTAKAVIDRAATLDLLRTGELRVTGRLLDASNASYCATIPDPSGEELRCVYKPLRGERPLDDFPDGTLGRREIAAYAISEALAWDIVPATVWREAGPYGPGVAQVWIDVDPAIDLFALVRSDLPELRRIAVFDAVINNGDRKGGHLLPVAGGHVHAVDHGVSFSVEPKLRTVLWGWRGDPLEAGTREALRALRRQLDGDLGRELRALLTRAEVEATRTRVDALVARARYPQPDPGRRAVPWPPF